MYHNVYTCASDILPPANWIAWQPLINANSDSNPSALPLITKLLFGIFLCTAVLIGEKFAIQFIAFTFHERSYAGQPDAGLDGDASVLTHPTRAHRRPEEGYQDPRSTLSAFLGTAGAVRHVACRACGEAFHECYEDVQESLEGCEGCCADDHHSLWKLS